MPSAEFWENKAGLPHDFLTRRYAFLRCFRPGFSVRGSRRGSTEDFRWDGTDRILREEFNSNWEKLDTQLKALADQGSSLQTALPKITSGTYTGNGSSTRKITLGFTPKAVMITSQNVMRICRAKDIRSTVKYNNRGCTRRAKNPQ